MHSNVTENKEDQRRVDMEALAALINQKIERYPDRAFISGRCKILSAEALKQEEDDNWTIVLTVREHTEWSTQERKIWIGNLQEEFGAGAQSGFLHLTMENTVVDDEEFETLVKERKERLADANFGTW